MKKSFITDINEINKNIEEAEKLLKESMGFYEEESMDDVDITEPVEDGIENESDLDELSPVVSSASVESYIDHIRKYRLNGLAALCDNPESEEYQMLKKIFQMCDKKAEKKENMTESHRLFGVLKENKRVVFETFVTDVKDFKNIKSCLVKEAIEKGYNPSDIQLLSEKKIIR
jgi:hypothetical protein